MRIQHNEVFLKAVNSSKREGKSFEKLASGMRINKAADDSAGLGISEKMLALINGLEMAQNNSTDAISLIQTAEGALNEVHSMLSRIRELTVQSSNGTYGDIDRTMMQQEIDSLLTEIDSISNSTHFNGIKLLDGSLGLDLIDDAIKTLLSSSGSASKPPVLKPAGHSLKLDLTTINNGSTFKVGSELFEFTTAGSVINPGANRINLTALNSGLTSYPKAEMNFGDLKITFSRNTDLKDVSVSFSYNRSNVINGESIDVTFAEKTVPEITYTDIVDTPPDADFGAEVIYKGIDGSAFKNGSTILINNILFEFTDTGSLNNTIPHPSGATHIAAVQMIPDDDGKWMYALDRAFLEYQDDTGDDTMYISFDEEVGDIEIKIGYNDPSVPLHQTHNIELNTYAPDGTKPIAGSVVNQIGVNTPSAPAINGERKDQINLSMVTDKSTMTINGVTFEFDTDKTTTPGNISVDISSVKNDLDKLDKLMFAFNSSPLSADFSLTAEKKVSPIGIIHLINLSARDDNIKIDYENIPNKDNLTEENSPGITFQIGAGSKETVTLFVESMTVDALKINNINVENTDSSNIALGLIDKAINKVSSNRATLGGLQNRLESTINNLSVGSENMTASYAQIRDADMAKEMMENTKDNILKQASSAIMAQAKSLSMGFIQQLMQG